MTQDQIAIHSGKNETRVLRFVNLEALTQDVQRMYNNGQIWGLYYQDGQVVAEDIWGDTHQAFSE